MSLNLITYIKEETLMKEKILVVEIKPGEHPKTSYLGTSLNDLQNAVGGYIELASMGDGCHILCNEEGKLRGLEPTESMAMMSLLVLCISPELMTKAILFHYLMKM